MISSSPEIILRLSMTLKYFLLNPSPLRTLALYDIFRHWSISFQESNFPFPTQIYARYPYWLRYAWLLTFSFYNGTTSLFNTYWWDSSSQPNSLSSAYWSSFIFNCHSTRHSICSQLSQSIFTIFAFSSSQCCLSRSSLFKRFYWKKYFFCHPPTLLP